MQNGKELLDLLIEIDRLKPLNFSGIGLVLYNKLENLPIVPLKIIESKICLPISKRNEIIEFLVSISQPDNMYHDGFHLLNSSLELTHLSQYISPPIQVDYHGMQFGSRYRTAYYTSFMNGVIACGVLSRNYGPTVFKNGVELEYY